MNRTSSSLKATIFEAEVANHELPFSNHIYFLNPKQNLRDLQLFLFHCGNEIAAECKRVLTFKQDP